MPPRKAGTALAAPTTTPNGLVSYQPPTIELDASDIQIPSIKMGQSLSSAVQDGNIKLGELYSSFGQDDNEPTALDQPLRFHVVGLRKGRSFSEPGGELQTWAFDDPEADTRSWVTYQWFVCIPELDTDLPYKVLMTKTSRPAAQKISLAIMRLPAGVPSFSLAWDLSTKLNTKGNAKYGVFQVSGPIVPENATAQDQHDVNVEACVPLARAAAEIIGSAPSGGGLKVETPEI